MTPDISAVMTPMLAEWDWLTSEQTEDLIKLASSLEAERMDIALGQLCARSLRFSVENSRGL